MNDLAPLYFYSFMLVLIYISCTLINLGILLTMTFLVFDVWFLDKLLNIFNKVKAYRRRRRFKLLKVQKDKE